MDWLDVLVRKVDGLAPAEELPEGKGDITDCRVFPGRPGPRSVKCSFNRAAVATTQGAGPQGGTRPTQSRTPCSSSFDRPPSTKVFQFRGRFTGQRLKEEGKWDITDIDL